MADDDFHHREEHRARIRRTKQFLRFVPRRARFHKYPLLGRFAAIARHRSYLWSFRTEHVRTALYVGPVVALQPIIGVQLPLALLLSVVLRVNFMIMGGLQFISNPFTALPLYYGTYQLGQAVITASGFGQSVEVVDPDHDLNLPHPTPAPPPYVLPHDPEAPPPEIKWSRRFGTSINALVLGGVVGGLAVGLVLDLLWRLGASRAAAHRAKVARRPKRSGSTVPSPPPQ